MTINGKQIDRAEWHNTGGNGAAVAVWVRCFGPYTATVDVYRDGATAVTVTEAWRTSPGARVVFATSAMLSLDAEAAKLFAVERVAILATERV